MAVALLDSLLLALTLTPSLAGLVHAPAVAEDVPELHRREDGGLLLRRSSASMSSASRTALRNRWFMLGLCALLLLVASARALCAARQRFSAGHG